MQFSIGDITIGASVQGTGETLVMLHSLGHNRSLYDGLAASFSAGHRVVCFDLRGHGETSLGNADPSLDRLADDLRQALSAHQVTKAHFVGQSIGAMVLLAAARLGMLSGSLFLLDTVAWTDDAWDERYLDRAIQAETLGMSAIADGIASASMARSTLESEPQIAAAYLDQLKITSPEGYAWACRAMVGFDFRPELGAITMPTLVLTGAEDKVATVDRSRETAAMIPNAQMEVIDGSGHLPVLEQGEKVCSLLRAWAQEHTLDV